MIATSARCTSAKITAPTRRCISAYTVTRPRMRCKADPDQAQRDNRSNQLNPNNPNYQVMEGGSTGYQGKGDKADLDNHANQMNPNTPNYPQQGNQQQQKK